MVEIIQNGISIHGSHQPSLELIANYLTKFVRSAQNSSKQPIIKPELQVLHLGYGALYDSLKVVPGDVRANWDEINPILILNLWKECLSIGPLAMRAEVLQEVSGTLKGKWRSGIRSLPRKIAYCFRYLIPGKIIDGIGPVSKHSSRIPSSDSSGII